MLFNEDQTKGQDTQQTQTQEDWLTKLVEVKGEKFKDPQVLAKSKLEADTYIKHLEEQLAEARQEIGKEDYVNKLLEQLQNKGADTTQAKPVVKDGGTEPSNTKPELSEDVIKSLVEQTLTEREKTTSAAKNAEAVRNELVSKYGTEAKAHVQKKAQELGISYERLSEIAQESPSAFFRLIGEEVKATKPLINGTVNTSAGSFQATAERDWSYYQNLRRTNKQLYFDPKTQQQMFADKLRLGDRFGNS